MPRKSLFLPLLFISFLLTSCEFHCSVGDAGREEKTKPAEKNGMALYNGIQLDTRGVRLNKAFLVTNDEKAERIDEGNVVDVKRGVKLLLFIDQGWKETDDRVFLGASLKVVTDNGQKVLEEDDLFSQYDRNGITPADAKVVGLSVFFNSPETNRSVSFDVTFRVWDKKGDGRIEGSYTFHTK